MKLLLEIFVVLLSLLSAIAFPRLGSIGSLEGAQDQTKVVEPALPGYPDDDIEAIANREYESAHGQILAVNMAHARIRKRKLEAERRHINETSTDGANAWEEIEKVNAVKGLDYLYQGDIIMDEDTEELLGLPVRSQTKRNADQAPHEKRNALRGWKRLWQTRIIPYQIPFNMRHIKKPFFEAIKEIQRKSCLRIVPYVPGRHRNYITFNTKHGCASKVGVRYAEPGRQFISLGDGCVHKRTILHEMMHAIGFFHEQARWDRDKFVEIKWENIIKGYSDQFDKYSYVTLNHLGTNYDYDSVMHYDRKAFTKNGEPTILAIGNPNKLLGRGNGLSPTDVIELNSLYDCQTRRYGWARWSAFTPCTDAHTKSRQRWCYHSGNAKRYCKTANVYGVEVQKIKCTDAEIAEQNKVAGHWGRWSDWRPCSQTCGDGTRTRFRRCDNPKPSKNGKKCVGASTVKGVCATRRCFPKSRDTDFEEASNPLGMWRNSRRGKLSWIRHKFYTQTMDTGPASGADHTLGTYKGHYIYMESSLPARPGNTAVIESPTLTGNPKGLCLKFYYYMYGRTLGSLQVLLKLGDRPPALVFRKQGQQGKAWKLATVTIAATGTYKLLIEGRVGPKTGYSDIAIDDIYIDDGVCACQDAYYTCARWAREGHCQSNAAWMRDHCKRSCKACVCTDKSKHCSAWASTKQCKKNPLYMLANCAKSCGVCGGGATATASCKDKDEKQCPLWAKIGECVKNKAWMLPNCRKSCKTCSNQDR